MKKTQPERELIRRVSPFVPVCLIVAYVAGWAAGGIGSGWSAAIGIGVVAVFFLAFALSMAWAAGISVTMIGLVAVGGYVVRLFIFVLLLVGLRSLAWFSPTAFALALVPATIALLIYEAKVFSGRMQSEIWSIKGAD